jgi:hypothetical protein
MIEFIFTLTGSNISNTYLIVPYFAEIVLIYHELQKLTVTEQTSAPQLVIYCGDKKH